MEYDPNQDRQENIDRQNSTEFQIKTDTKGQLFKK